MRNVRFSSWQEEYEKFTDIVLIGEFHRVKKLAAEANMSDRRGLTTNTYAIFKQQLDEILLEIASRFESSFHEGEK